MGAERWIFARLGHNKKSQKERGGRFGLKSKESRKASA